jgi:hypothetical protein
VRGAVSNDRPYRDSHFLEIVPDVIAQEIVDDLKATLEQFRLISNDLGSDTSEKVT